MAASFVGRLKRELPLSPRQSWNRNVRRVDRHLRLRGGARGAALRRTAIGLCACFALAAVLTLEHAVVTRLPERQARFAHVRSEPAPRRVATQVSPAPPPQQHGLSSGAAMLSRLVAEKAALEKRLRLSMEEGRAMKKSRDRAMALAQAQLALPPAAPPPQRTSVDKEIDSEPLEEEVDDLSGEAHEWDDFSEEEPDAGFDESGNVIDFD